MKYTPGFERCNSIEGETIRIPNEAFYYSNCLDYNYNNVYYTDPSLTKTVLEGTKWGGEVTKKEMRRLVISWNHYQRKREYISKLKVIGVAKLWEDEMGEKGILDLFIEPLPPTFQ